MMMFLAKFLEIGDKSELESAIAERQDQLEEQSKPMQSLPNTQDQAGMDKKLRTPEAK